MDFCVCVKNVYVNLKRRHQTFGHVHRKSCCFLLSHRSLALCRLDSCTRLKKTTMNSNNCNTNNKNKSNTQKKIRHVFVVARVLKMSQLDFAVVNC